MKEYADSELMNYCTNLHLYLHGIGKSAPTITPVLTSSECQGYVYEKNGPFFSSEEAALITCLYVQPNLMPCSTAQEQQHAKDYQGLQSLP